MTWCWQLPKCDLSWRNVPRVSYFWSSVHFSMTLMNFENGKTLAKGHESKLYVAPRLCWSFLYLYYVKLKRPNKLLQPKKILKTVGKQIHCSACVDQRRRLRDQGLLLLVLGDSNSWRRWNKYSGQLTLRIYSTSSNNFKESSFFFKGLFCKNFNFLRIFEI